MSTVVLSILSSVPSQSHFSADQLIWLKLVHRSGPWSQGYNITEIYQVNKKQFNNCQVLTNCNL